MSMALVLLLRSCKEICYLILLIYLQELSRPCESLAEKCGCGTSSSPRRRVCLNLPLCLSQSLHYIVAEEVVRRS